VPFKNSFRYVATRRQESHLLRQVGMSCSYTIPSKVEYQRLTLVPLVLLDSAQKNNVIAAIKLPNVATEKMSYGPFQ